MHNYAHSHTYSVMLMPPSPYSLAPVACRRRSVSRRSGSLFLFQRTHITLPKSLNEMSHAPDFNKMKGCKVPTPDAAKVKLGYEAVKSDLVVHKHVCGPYADLPIYIHGVMCENAGWSRWHGRTKWSGRNWNGRICVSG